MNKRQRKKCFKKQFGHMELGNILWGHSSGNYEVNRAFQDRFYNFLVQIGYDGYGCKDPESKNSVDNRFVVRPYWWGDDDAPEVKLPNFECKELGLELSWYKYPLRDSYSNIPFTEGVMKKLEKMAFDSLVL